MASRVGAAVGPVLLCSCLGRVHRLEAAPDRRRRTPAPRATADEFVRRIVERNPDAIAELFAEKVDWRLDWPADGHPAVPWIRPRSTRADVADHFRELREAHVPQPIPTPAVLVDGSDAVVP